MNIIEIVLNTLLQLLRGIAPWIYWALFLIIILTVGLFIWINTHKYSGFRGVFTYVGHLLIFFIGWSAGRGWGILVIAIPLLLIFYHLLCHIAMAVVPASDLDSRKERLQRFSLYFWYTWGFQYPIFAVTDLAGRNVEKRIRGSAFRKYCAPGLVLAPPHQAVGLTIGIAFSRIDRPGTVFTKPYERPFEVVDLRTQLRTSWVEVVSKDGVPFRARIFASFRVDNEKWGKEVRHELLRRDPTLARSADLDYIKGSYPIASGRLRALMSTIGVYASAEEEIKPKVHWDEWALMQIERTACSVLSKRRVDELWHSGHKDREADLSVSDQSSVASTGDVSEEGDPCGARDGTNAFGEISQEINDTVSLMLRQKGIKLYSCRIVDLNFSIGTEALADESAKKDKKISAQEQKKLKEDDVQKQQIATWRADWAREAIQIRSEGEAEAERLRREAHAYAHSVLLTAIAEGMKETRLLHPELPHYVIALHFVSELEELTRQQSGEGDSADEVTRSYLKNWQRLLALYSSQG